MKKAINTKFKVSNRTEFLKTINPSYPTLEKKIGKACADSADQLLDKIRIKRNNDKYESYFSISHDNIYRYIELSKIEEVEFTVRVLNTFLCFFFFKKPSKYRYTETHTEENLKSFFNFITISNGKYEDIKTFNKFINDLELIKEHLTPLFNENTFKINKEWEFLITRNYSPIYIEIQKESNKLIKDESLNTTSNSLDILNSKFAPSKFLNYFPKIRSDDHIGRKDNIAELREILTSENSSVLIKGIGGIGKTSLALMYSNIYKNNYDHFIYLNSNGNLEDSILYDNLLHRNLNLSENKLIKLYDVVYAISKLETRNILLIIDNAILNEHSLLSKFNFSSNIHIIIISRESILNIKAIDLLPLTIFEGVSLFKKYCNKISNDEHIVKIVESLGCHTLTIEILAKTIQKLRLQYSYLKQYEWMNLDIDISTRHSDFKSIEHISKYLSSIFEISNLNQLENKVLYTLSCLPNIFHSFESLLPLFEYNNINYNYKLSQTLENLEIKGWLTKDETIDSYKMHEIVSNIIRGKNNITSYDDVIGIYERILISYYKSSNLDFEELSKTIEFAEHALKIFGDSNSELNLHLLISLSHQYLLCGNYNKSLSFISELSKKHSKDKLQPYLYLLTTIFSSCTIRTKRFDKAKIWCRKAIQLQMREDLSDPNEIDILILAYRSYCKVLVNLKKPEEAQEQIKILRNLDKNNTKHITNAVENEVFALLNFNKNHLEKSKSYYIKALRMYKLIDIEDNIFITIYTKIGEINYLQKNYKQSINYYNKVLDILKNRKFESHPDNFECYDKLIKNYMNLEDYESARSIYKDTIRILCDKKKVKYLNRLYINYQKKLFKVRSFDLIKGG